MPFPGWPLLPVSHYLDVRSNFVGIVGLILTSVLVLRAFVKSQHTLLSDAPIVGQQWRFEPRIITRYRYVFNGWEITRKGWEKYKDSIFTILRPDSNVTVLPTRYVDELQNLPDNILHPIEALSQDLHGTYTGMNILLGTHLSFNVVRNKLTPQLSSTIPVLAEELEYAFSVEIPSCRVTSRFWVGFPLCRNEEWHTANIYTTSRIFYTALILKCLPVFLHGIVVPLLPFKRQLQHGLDRVFSHLIPLIKDRIRQRSGEDPSKQCAEDVLQWMIDAAEGEEKSPENLALRYVFTIIGSLYTVSGGLVDCLYDLTAYPEYISPLRDEVRQALASEGGWNKGTLSKLPKMDSFMRESQRTNAPSPISFKRIVKQQITLSDGVILPVGTYVCVVNTSTLENQSDSVGDQFDGFRYSRKRQQVAGLSTRHQYSSTDKQHITFGHGRFACPGRFVAAAEIKIVLAMMLERYQISFGEGCARPKNLHLLELGFQDPSTRVYLREWDNP
ncbi:cytochrome P450 [Xylaria cf. heliscus]|nr:cytochrome P450 [Xylaria cf. heliscus]